MRDDVHVALLRAVNVGGKHKLPMAELVGMFTAAGCGAARSFIQSGNVVFRAAPRLAPRIPALIEKAIADRFGFHAPVVVRTGAELREVAEKNPFIDRGEDPDKLHVAFLADRPTAAAVASLDPKRSPPDELIVRGRELYLFTPNGVGRSKITAAYLDARLKTVVTARNWRTVQKLVALVDSLAKEDP